MNDPVIEPTAKLGDLVREFPGIRRALFRGYHIGGCSQCAYDDNETLAELCARNDGLDVDEVAGYLRNASEEDKKYLIEPLALKALLDSSVAPQLLDVRSREEFDAVRISGSQFFKQEMMQQILAEWDRGESIVVVDHDGKKGLDAAAFFTGHQFTKVKALRGGIDAYSLEADPSLPRYEIEIG